MFLLIDNYDSFTFNLVQAFRQLGREPVVLRNDDPSLLDLAAGGALDMVCISPGPGRPENAGLCLEFLRVLPPSVPVLGVCLGHQLLGHMAGARVEVGSRVMHGKQSEIRHEGLGLFQGLPRTMQAGRYHSLLVRAEDAPALLRVDARSEEDEVMALSFTDRPWAGVQFHPESVLTPEGFRLLANFPSALLAPRAPVEAAPSFSTEAARSISQPKAPPRMPSILESLARRENLSPEAAGEAFSRLMDGELPPAQAGALLLGLRIKGETPEEVGEAVRAVLARAVPVPPVSGACIDVVGTGGDVKGSFNCSTAVSLSLAGMGHKVLKHGNRSVSSRCGSADVLEKIGLPLDTPPEAVPALLEKEGFVFLFAPRYHPAFKNVMPIRRELGVGTIFNILGPLVNPGKPTHHFLGVAKPEQLSLVADTLARSSGGSGAVVHGAGAYDELTPMGEASLIFVREGKTWPGVLDPAAYGFKPCAEKDLTVRDPEDAAGVLRELLNGKGPAPMRDMLAFNLGFALYLLGPENGEAVDPARGFAPRRMSAAMEEARKAVAEGAGRKFCRA
ncbi:MAG: anthranilate phosphoribosyltransferase [Deltaproteobacteria bacterium]|jgi:anthranilate synthase/phosphoribosyltransferase|nr:anthranilate phosphoribosyltransferase [Deltaproteobacteria bacterium]